MRLLDGMSQIQGALAATTPHELSNTSIKSKSFTPQPPQPPPPPLAELITLVLAVPVEKEGQITAEEALAILNVTHKSPRWLLAQVHPDKHPHHTSQAQAATARVNQARDIRCRHVTDWTQ